MTVQSDLLRRLLEQNRPTEERLGGPSIPMLIQHAQHYDPAVEAVTLEQMIGEPHDRDSR
jgi:hypothetical protein